MSSTTFGPTSAASQSASASRPESAFDRLVGFVIRRRVAISILVFGTMVIEDLVTGVVPRNILNVTDRGALLGLTAVLAGLALRSWAAGFLMKNTELTTSGPYALVRNPLYLGSFLMVAGFSILMNDRENIWILPIVFALIYAPKVRAEERLLAGYFPNQWPAYSARTPRFIPRSIALPRFAGWRFAQWRRSREYNAVAATFASLVGLVIVRYLHS